MKKDENSWTKHLPAIVRREPKKAITLAILGVVLLLMAARQVSGGPAKATAAAPTASKPADNAQKLSAAPAAVGSEYVLAWVEMPIERPRRDGFAIDYAQYPAVEPIPRQDSNGATLGFWEDLRKSVVLQADLSLQQQTRRQALVASARGLKLQTTLQGASPAALIDGQVYRPGDEIEAADRVRFRIVRVEERSVILEASGLRVELDASGRVRPVDQ